MAASSVVPVSGAPLPSAADKAAGAYRTIGELSRETGLPQHILRYWETRFPQLRPLQRAGNRRYYRPEDAALVRRIAAMLGQDGYTIRGVQKALMNERKRLAPILAATPTPDPATPDPATPDPATADAIRAVRDDLTAALDDDLDPSARASQRR